MTKPVPPASAEASQLTDLIARWRTTANGCRVLAADALTPLAAAAYRAASVNRDECARELELALAALRETPAVHKATEGDIERP